MVTVILRAKTTFSEKAKNIIGIAADSSVATSELAMGFYFGQKSRAYSFLTIKFSKFRAQRRGQRAHETVCCVHAVAVSLALIKLSFDYN